MHAARAALSRPWSAGRERELATLTAQERDDSRWLDELLTLGAGDTAVTPEQDIAVVAVLLLRPAAGGG